MSLQLEDVLKDVKSKFEEKIQTIPKAVGPGHRKVLARNEKWFITEVPGKWRLDYERRKDYCNAGCFSTVGVPYKTFANFRGVEVHNLIEDALSIKLSRGYTHFQSHSRSNRIAAYTTHDDDNDIIAIYDASARRKKIIHRAPTAGLDLISRELGSHTRTLHDIKAGCTLQDSLQRESLREDVLQVLKAPKIIFHKGQKLSISKPCTYLPPMLPTASSKICLLSTPPKSMINPGGEGEEEVASRIKKMFRPANDREEEIHKLRALLRKNFYAKVKSIYATLCCLHNIKNKDLKRYKPLSFSTIKSLARQPHHLTSKDQYHLYTGSLIPHHNMPNLQSHYCSNVATTSNKQPKGSLPVWEDIMLLHEHKIWHSSSSSNVDPKKQHRVLPAWKRKVKITEARVKGIKPDMAKNIASCIQSFHHFKGEMAQKVAKAIHEKQQVRERTINLNLQYYVCGPVLRKSLHEMRAKTCQISWAEQNKDMEKPDWFIVLEEEVLSAFGEDGMEREGNAALECLKYFIVVGTETIHFVIQKMCLFAISLPAHYLCTEQVILALQFVCEFFLKITPKIFVEQLREICHLPPLLQQLHSPDVLFGMCIYNHVTKS